jgi:hypothetical protein
VSRQVIFVFPDGDSERRWLETPPEVGSIVSGRGQSWQVQKVQDDERCLLVPVETSAMDWPQPGSAESPA